MDRAAYNFGVQIALAEYGLVKEAGPSWEGAKLLGQRAGGHLKDFFTGRNVRAALAKLPEASKVVAPEHIPASIGSAAASKIQNVLKPGVQAKDLVPVMDEIQKMLGTAAGPGGGYAQAKKELLKSLIPYATVGGLGALGGGGYLTAKKVYPKAFGD
jgi:hypothetical protein